MVRLQLREGDGREASLLDEARQDCFWSERQQRCFGVVPRECNWILSEGSVVGGRWWFL